MNTKKVFLLSDDIFLFSGIKAWLPNLVLADVRTYIAETQSFMPQYSSCLLIIDNRLPVLRVSKWLQRNSTQFLHMICVVIRMNGNDCISRGYEKYSVIKGQLPPMEMIARIKEKLFADVDFFDDAKCSPLFAFRLTEFEKEMLCASFSKERLRGFCSANSLTIKSLYRYRDKITCRLGLSSFNEVIIFLTRNRLLGDHHSTNRPVREVRGYGETPDASETRRLSMAIRNDDIIPYFQPIVNNAGEVQGVEILARWPQGHHYAVSQREVLPLAEKTGLMNELTRYLMSSVARNLLTANFDPHKTWYVSFNISPTSLSNPVFYWDCLHFMERVHRLPVKLMIEITENKSLNITPAIRELIRSLRNRGVLFALDDFGTGYANLCYLNDLELDMIKIDKSFVNGIKEVDQRIPTLESIIQLARILGLRTVAEGVEHDYQQQWLEKHHVDYLQGYYYLPPATFPDFIRYYRQADKIRGSGLACDKKYASPLTANALR